MKIIINLRLILLLVCISILNACQKESPIQTNNNKLAIQNEITLLTKTVKNWHDSIVSYSSKPTVENNIKSLSLGSNDIIPPVINWNKAFKNFDNNGRKSISVPLSYDSITGNYLQLVTSLVNNKITGFIVSTLPDISYHKIHKNKYDFSGFTGTVIVYDVTGKCLSKVDFKQGNDIKSINNNPLNKEQIKSFEGETLPEVVVTTSIKKNYTTYLLIFYNNMKGITNQNLELSFDGGVVAGGDDLTIEMVNIQNKMIDECLVNIVNKITDANLGNELTKKMLLVFGKTDRINLIFEQGLNSEKAAQFKFQSNGPLIANYYITIDPTKLKRASNEYIASCLAHEIAHALIRNSYTDVNVYNQLTMPGRHYEMLINYVTIMQYLLQETFNLEESDALSLIFAGLSDLNAEISDSKVKEEWDSEFRKIVLANNFSLINNDPNYYYNSTFKYQSGNKGTISCPF